MASLTAPRPPGSVSYDVQLLLPTDHYTTFDLGVTAFSQETGIGDPDEASATATQHIECCHCANVPSVPLRQRRLHSLPKAYQSEAPPPLGVASAFGSPAAGIDRHRAVGAPPDKVRLAVAVDVAEKRRRPAKRITVDYSKEACAATGNQCVWQRHTVAAARKVELFEPADAAELRRWQPRRPQSGCRRR